MKTTTMRISLFLLLMAGSLSALNIQDRNLGLGIFVGGGITHGGQAGVHGKFWSSKTDAWDAAVTWGSGNRWGSINLQADRLWNFFDLIRISGDAGTLPLYAGVGGWLGAWANEYWSAGVLKKETKFGLGVRFPLGFSYLAKQAPLEGFLEVAPGLALFPSAVFTFDIMLGGHFYF